MLKRPCAALDRGVLGAATEFAQAGPASPPFAIGHYPQPSVSRPFQLHKSSAQRPHIYLILYVQLPVGNTGYIFRRVRGRGAGATCI
jgi:hypothetical protein